MQAETPVGMHQRLGSSPRTRQGRHREHGGLHAVSCLRAPARGITDFAALAGLLMAAGFIFFWNLSSSGYANEFYSAAAQAASQNWEAFLWGSLDASNAITVDKPPASIWFMALSVRALGLSSFAILLPQAIMGVATTYALYGITRRYWGNAAGILAGALFITTPVTALMFRFNNPDALLVLLMTLAAGCVLRALELSDARACNRRRTAWIALAGCLVGFGFLTKQFQVLLVVPGFALALFAFSPTRWWRRLIDGAVAIASIVVAAGWWVALTVIVPSGSRPYIGGSQTDSFLELTFSYNGLGRLTGNETGSVVAGGGNQAGNWGETGLSRLFGSDFGDQFAWFALFAFVGIAVGVIAALALRGRKALAAGDPPAARGTPVVNGAVAEDGSVDRRVRRLRLAAIAIFGCWLVITWLVFSFMAGIFHQYYTVALAPAVSVMAAICLASFYQLREHLWVRLAAILTCALSAVWAFVLIGRSGSYAWLAWAVLIADLVPCIVLCIRLLGEVSQAWQRNSAAGHALRTAATACICLALSAGPVAWTAATISTGHSGSIVAAGPSGSGGTGGGGGGNPGGGNGVPGGTEAPADGEGADGGPGGSKSSLLGGGSASEKVIDLLLQNASGYRWAAATTGSQNAASYQLASELPVMAIGGFNGTDPAPTLEQFKEYVEQGQIRYYIEGGEMGGKAMGGSDAASQIQKWVEENFEAQTVGNVTIYDLAS